MSITQQIGQAGEQLALRYLKKNGLSCVQRNYACRYGEIDLIMRDDEEYVFVEVRLRTSSGYGSGVDSVTLTKQRKLIKTAQHYNQQHRLSDDIPMRFDVVGIGQDGLQIDWITNAFTL